MTSHEYEFDARDVARLLGRPLLVVALFSIVIHALTWAGWLPRPWPALDMDRVILLHQADASRSRRPAEIILLGDSSCLMDVDTVRLGARLGRGVLGLGTLSYLDLESTGELLAGYARANPGFPRVAVLLMHPYSLRLRISTGYHAEALRCYLAGQDHFNQGTRQGRLDRWLGLEQWRGRVLARWLPQPLTGGYGTRYGFTHDLWHSLDANRGSAVDPHQFTPGEVAGSTEYRLASGLEPASGAFRRRVPDDMTLAVGVTPVPARLAGPEPEARGPAILKQWSAWLSPATMLTNLPFAMADHLFASATHLNAQGRERYTDLLADQLRTLLGETKAAVPDESP